MIMQEAYAGIIIVVLGCTSVRFGSGNVDEGDRSVALSMC
jgi:hypothetical protein